MSEILQITTTGAALVALIFAFLSWLLSRANEKSINTVRDDSNRVREELRDVKVQVQHTDLEFIKKILVRVSDSETAVKRLENMIDLTDEKLKSFMNRVNARGQRPAKEPETEKEISQEDLLKQLEASGDAIPLRPPNGSPSNQPLTLVRASAARKQRAG